VSKENIKVAHDPVVNALLLPVSETSLLVPMSAVAEVVGSGISVFPLDKPDPKIYGWINWRNQRLPLLSFEGISGALPVDFDTHSLVVILNAIESASSRGFYGLALQGFPRRVKVAGKDSNVSILKLDKRGAAYDAGNIGEPALIPDFKLLEKVSNQASETAGS
jgi:chemosensory pili system protein ChpC